MLNNEISHKYDDILSMPHPNSKNHPRMARRDRAAQFSSFAALTGHEEKAGGRYESYAGVVKKMDEYKRELVFNDHTVIPMHQIVNIEADWLERSSNEDITCD